MSVALPKTAAERTPFIGRRRELELLEDAMRSGARLLSLTGPSGMGKTRLARQILLRRGKDYEGGVRFCSLASSQAPGDLESAVATAIGVSQQPGVDLAVALDSRGPMLLILDNLDEIAASVGPILQRWLDHCEALQILVTSIVPLGLEEEVRVEMGPLELEDALALYLERANRAWAGKAFSAEDQGVIRALVTRLDRCPLAIELAAARVRVLTPRALLARIDDRFDLLQSEKRGRHRSLLSAIRFTWELLAEEEQRALMRLSTFAGGFGFEAAEALLSALPKGALDLLDALRSKALLQVEDEDPLRFALYESVRDFAAMELQRSGEEEEALRAHATYFVEAGEAWAAEVLGPAPLPAIRWLQAERKNLIAAHRRALDFDLRLATRAGHVLGTALELEGPPASELHLLDSTVEAARQSGDPSLLLRSLRFRSVALTRHGKIREASQDSDEGLRVARAHGDEVSEGFLLANVARYQILAGALAEASANLDRVLAITEAHDAPVLGGAGLVVKGLLEETRGDLEASERACQQSLAIYRQIDFVLGQGYALLMLGTAQGGQGKFNEARAAFREAFRIFSTSQILAGEADATLNLGGVEATAGRLEEAEIHIRRAMELQRANGSVRHQGVTILNLASIAMQRGQWRKAESHLQECLLIFESAGDRRLHAEALWLLSILDAISGRESEARQTFERAESYYRDASDPSLEPRMALLEAFLERSGANASRQAGDEEEARRLEAGAEARVERVAAKKKMNEGLIGMIRLFRHFPQGADRSAREGPSTTAPRRLLVGQGGEWFEFEGRRADLRRRRTARRMLLGLIEQRERAPGEGLCKEALFQIGWEGEKIRPDAAASRVYVGVQTLRSLGLEGALQRNFQGYFLDPEIPIHRVGDETLGG